MCNLRTTVYLTQLAMPCLQISFPTAEAGHCPSTYSPGAPLSLYIFIFVVLLSHCLLPYCDIILKHSSAATPKHILHTTHHSTFLFTNIQNFVWYSLFQWNFVNFLSLKSWVYVKIMPLLGVTCNSLTCYIFALWIPFKLFWCCAAAATQPISIETYTT